jgi:transposase
MYVRIVKDQLRGSPAGIGDDKGDGIVQHDNDPKHGARKTREWLKDNGIEVLVWPAQSPDLPPIERVWYEVDRKLRKHPTTPKDKYELWGRLQEAWPAIEPAYIRKRYESMPRRADAVRKAHGGHTKY